MSENFIWLRTNPPSRKPPQGCVQLSYSPATGTIEVIDELGTTIPFEGAELSDTLDALSVVDLTPSTILSVNSSGVPVAASYATVKSALGINLVDNTSDANKPISTATQAALDLKQPLDATLTALAGQNWAANSVPVGNDVDGVAQLVLDANTFLGRSSTGGAAAKPVTDSALSALSIAVGSAGGIVVNGGGGGTPSSINLSNGTNLPLTTGVTGTLGVTNGGNGLATATLGEIRYGSGTNTLAALTGNTSATMSVLTQTGNGSVSAAPAWTSTTGTGNVVRADTPTFTTRTNSPIYRGTGTDVVIQDGAGNQAFRSINATTWTDSAAGQYFQIGGSSVNVIFTAGSATNVNRFGHFAEFFQVSSGARASCPIPVDRLEVVNSSNAKVFGVDNAGGVVIGAVAVGSLPTASTNTYRQFVVTDANAPALGATVAAGGSAKATVRSNGTNWIVTEIL